MSKPASTRNPVELACVTLLVGECAVVIYVIGMFTMQALQLW